MSHLFLRTIFQVLLVLFLVNIKFAEAAPPNQQLTEPLKAKPGSQTVSEEFLVNLKQSFNSLRYSKLMSLNWMDEETILYELDGQIELLEIETSTRTSLGKGYRPRISPDGHSIAFFKENDQVIQIWVMKRDGSEQRQLTHQQLGFVGICGHHYHFAWSFDSRKLAFYINPDLPDEESSESIPAPSQINVIDIFTGYTQKVYSDFALLRSLSWYPDNQQLLMDRIVDNKEERSSYVQSVNLIDGHVSILAKFAGLQQHLSPTLSQDGLKIALLYNAESDLFNWMPSIGIVDSQNTSDEVKALHQLTFDMKFYQTSWSKDNRYLFGLRNYGAYNQIYRIDSRTGNVNQITSGSLNISGYWISPNGTKLIWTGMDAQGSSIFRMSSIEGNNVEELIFEKGCKDGIALSEVREIEWTTVNYPSKMRGLLLLPLNYTEGKKYPLVIDIHGGGPGSSIYLSGGILNDSNPLEWQIWTAKGYAVFVPEFRSSAAFGFLAILRDDFQNHDLVNCDILDIIAGLDELVRQGIVDNHRVAVIGHSAGGRRANWLTVSTKRFRVVVSKEGWADESERLLTIPFYWPAYGGSPLEAPQNYQKNSALHHSKGASTPTLFLMGNPKLGGVDPYQTVKQLYEALKDQGVETEYVQYMDEGHNFYLPKNRRDALKRAIEWIDYYTQDYSDQD